MPTSEIVIFTHTDYNDIWHIITQTLTEIIGTKIAIYFAINKDVSISFKKYLYTESNTYPQRIIEILKQSQSDYILFFHDNDILMSFNNNKYEKLLDFMKTDNITRLILGVLPSKTFYKQIDSIMIGKADENCSEAFLTPYDVGPSIWNRIDLINIMSKFINETYRTIESSAIQEECKKYTIVGICYINTPVKFTQGRPFSTDFSFCHILLRGKWIPEEAQQDYRPFFQDLFSSGIIDPSIRGFIPHHGGMDIKYLY